MSSFYHELMSNAFTEYDLSIKDNKLFPYNTIGNFKNEINLLHRLEGNWEVGVAEISYTKSWKNLKESCVLSIEKLYSDVTNPVKKAYLPEYFPHKDYERHGVVRDGHYDSIQQLCNEINEEMKAIDENNYPEFIYDDIRKKVFLVPAVKDKEFLAPYLTEELAELLGFDYYSTKNPIMDKQAIIVAQRAADITAGIHELFVYCNILVPQYIGNTTAKLLKVVKIPNNSKYRDQIVITYERPQYVPLIVSDFKEIEIDIRDDSNQPIRFMEGRTRIKLHFRKCHI